jgi:hypothetical protein
VRQIGTPASAPWRYPRTASHCAPTDSPVRPARVASMVTIAFDWISSCAPAAKASRSLIDITSCA